MVIELGLVLELKMDYRRYSTSDREIVVSADKIRTCGYLL
jgi:hypothetical protein